MDRDREAEPLRIVVADGDALLRKALAATLHDGGHHGRRGGGERCTRPSS